MSGRKMDQARAAGHQLLGTLSERDRFRLIDFSTDVRSFRDDFVPATRANLAAAERYLEALRAEGSTNISGALQDALDVRTPGDRVPVVIFVTDGEPTVGERTADGIAAMASRLRGRARVFTVGVGSDVNTPLVEQLAVDGRGTAQFLRPDESVERAVGLVAGRLTSPVLTDVRVHAEGSGVRLINVHPVLPADIFAGQDLVLFARYEGNGDGRIVVEGRTSDGPVSWTERVHFPDRDRENSFVARLWASQRIGWLAAEKRRNGGNTEIDNEIRDLGTRFGIPTEFSSYLVLEPGMRVGAGGGGVPAASPVADSMRRASIRDQAASTVRLAEVVATGAASGSERRKDADFEAAKTASAQRDAKSLAAMDSIVAARARRADGLNSAPRNESRAAGDRTFVLRNGVWTDARWTPTPKVRTVKIKAFSAAYFALLQQLEDLRAPFAIGDRVLVAGRNVSIEVAPDGVEQLAARELAAIVTDW
jgi:Ca-activated chloride channel family protein